MNDTKYVMEFLEKVAAKLGVATDILWAALLRQAVISSIVQVLWIAAGSYALVWLVRYVKYVNQRTKKDWDEIAWLPCVFVCGIAAILTIITFVKIPMTLAGFFNPDYWALMKILDTCNR